MKGYKVFNNDWTCRGFKYEVGQTYTMVDDPKCCECGFHFCKKLSDCFNHYDFDTENKVAIVEAIGDIDTKFDKSCTNKIRIIKEITWDEIFDLVSLGEKCTGFKNTGNYNSGDFNTGEHNSGDYNTGSRNAGNYNTGSRNAGNCNTGNCNAGSCNTGNYNTGNYNTGSYNSGSYNSGRYNTGTWNSGNCNVGSGNNGVWNKASNVIGCFNTKPQKMKFFNKETDMTCDEWVYSDAYYILYKMALNQAKWINETDMTDKEKTKHPYYKTTGGYLKDVDNADYRIKWWKNLSNKDKEIIKSMPNFDAEIFKEITGIDVNKEV